MTSTTRCYARALLGSCELLVGACGAGLPEWFTAIYARRTTAPRRDGLRPRGCWLVLLRSVCNARKVLTRGREVLVRRATRR